jgi:hypothetical protein
MIWAIGQVTRIRRQHTTEDSFQGIGNQLTQLGSTQATIMERFTVLQAQTKNIPALQPLIQDLSNLTLTANTQVTAANTAVIEARSRESLPTLGWVSDWPLPQRLIPDPRICDSAMGGSRGPPLVLMDSIMRFAAEKRMRVISQAAPVALWWWRPWTMGARANCASPTMVRNLPHSGPSFTRQGSGVESRLCRRVLPLALAPRPRASGPGRRAAASPPQALCSVADISNK